MWNKTSCQGGISNGRNPKVNLFRLSKALENPANVLVPSLHGGQLEVLGKSQGSAIEQVTITIKMTATAAAAAAATMVWTADIYAPFVGGGYCDKPLTCIILFNTAVTERCHYYAHFRNE